MCLAMLCMHFTDLSLCTRPLPHAHTPLWHTCDTGTPQYSHVCQHESLCLCTQYNDEILASAVMFRATSCVSHVSLNPPRLWYLSYSESALHCCEA